MKCFGLFRNIKEFQSRGVFFFLPHRNHAVLKFFLRRWVGAKKKSKAKKKIGVQGRYNLHGNCGKRSKKKRCHGVRNRQTAKEPNEYKKEKKWTMNNTI